MGAVSYAYINTYPMPLRVSIVPPKLIKITYTVLYISKSKFLHFFFVRDEENRRRNLAPVVDGEDLRS
jgi:hypothetical protein